MYYTVRVYETTTGEVVHLEDDLTADEVVGVREEWREAEYRVEILCEDGFPP